MRPQDNGPNHRPPRRRPQSTNGGEREEINWSAFIRQSIEERLSKSDRRRIQEFVEGYEGDLEALFALHMFTHRISRQHIYESMERLFDEELDAVVDEVDRDLQDLNISRLTARSPTGIEYSDLIRGEIEDVAGDEMDGYIRDRIATAPPTVKEGLRFLPHFVRDRYDDDGASAKRASIERTWSLRSDTDVDPDSLVQTGLAYKNTYSSNAYHYDTFQIPGIAIDIIEEFERRPSQFDLPSSHPAMDDVEALLEEAAFDTFLEWMDGTSTLVDKHNEREEIQEFLGDRETSENEFLELRRRLIDSNLLVLRYRPHRSAAGSRSSRPARWRYEFTDPATDLIATEFLE